MPTDDELAERRKRRSWWLRVARETRGLSQKGVAKALGLSEKSASTVGDWERGVSEPSLFQLERLAGLYGAPLVLFTAPPPTDEERFLALAVGAVALERGAWDQGPGASPSSGDGRSGEPQTPPQ